jgi:hypothetical protein
MKGLNSREEALVCPCKQGHFWFTSAKGKGSGLDLETEGNLKIFSI